MHGPATDLHSGYFGGLVRNPLEALAQILASLKDRDGRVAVAGFSDGVRAPERRANAPSTRRCRSMRPPRHKALGVAEFAGEAGFAPLERMWLRPTLEINGMYGGYQGPGGKTIVPSFAVAKVSARLVPAQDPEHVKAAVAAHVRAVAPPGVRVEVEAHGNVRAVETSRDHPAIAAAARAMTRGFGKPPVFIGTGGTIGPVSSFDRILGLPQVLIGVGLPDDAIHAPNEKFDLGQFFGGIETMTYLYDELAESLSVDEGPMSQTDRFTGRADVYEAGRPSYPAESLDALFAGLGDPATLVVADLGAGTGISTRILAARGRAGARAGAERGDAREGVARSARASGSTEPPRRRRSRGARSTSRRRFKPGTGSITTPRCANCIASSAPAAGSRCSTTSATSAIRSPPRSASLPDVRDRADRSAARGGAGALRRAPGRAEQYVR